LELLPVFAVFPAILAGMAIERAPAKLMRTAVWCALLAIVGSAYLSAYGDAPITLREARVNSRSRIALEDGLAKALEQLPPGSTLLMYEAEHAGALREAGIPLRHVISEAEHPDWELALLDPAHQTDYAIACQGDPVWAGLRQHENEFEKLVAVSAPWQATCTVYKRKLN
jgi:hypothetical protein